MPRGSEPENLRRESRVAGQLLVSRGGSLLASAEELMGTVKYPAQATPGRSSVSRVPENGTHGLKGGFKQRAGVSLYRAKILPMTEDFLDQGRWTPQTFMMRAIQKWIGAAAVEVEEALSIDKNPTMEPLIREKWPQVRIHEGVYPEQDAMALRHPDSTFDLVFSHQVLEHIPRPWLAAQEMIRVLKPGGIGIHTTCAFNPRHGQPHFQDYYRFHPEGLVEVFSGMEVAECAEWGNREAIRHNVSVDDGHGMLGGRRFGKDIGSWSDGLYPWVSWIIFHKPVSLAQQEDQSSANAGASMFEQATVERDSHNTLFLLKKSEWSIRERLLNRSCDDQVFSAFARILRPGQTVVDVGAHVGRYSVHFSRLVGPEGKVWALEPVPDNYWMLEATLALNRVENVTAKQVAVSSTDGMAEINVFDDPFSSWSSLGSPTMLSPDGREIRPKKQVAVITQTLERFCREHSIGYIHGLKIDVEGFEQAALTGALPLLKDHSVGMICFEVSELPLAGTGFSPDMIRELLNACGYNIYTFDLSEEKFRPVEGDYACFHGNFYAFATTPEPSKEI